MSRFVRQSKFRHVFGKADKAELCYDNTLITRTAWDANFIAANNTYWAMQWQTAGGGSVCVWPLEKRGKLPQKANELPLIVGHKSHVLDVAWHPFNSSLLATVSEDAYGKIWSVPDGGLTENMTEPVQTLKGHRRKVGSVNFHPSADNVVATSSQDYTVKLWDIVTGDAKLTLDGPKDLIQSLDWNRDGSEIAITSKDKKIRVGDPRQEKWATEFDGHLGVKGSRCRWVDDGKLFTIGFGRSSDRQYALHDTRNTEKPLVQVNIDNSSGILMLFYDFDTKMIYLAGKGDGNIRYYEYTGEDKLIYYLSEFKSNTPQRGGCFIPKTACSVSDNEVARFLKVENNKVSPISFTVPRKSDLFQDDLFPHTADGGEDPALTSDQYFGGENADPKTVDLEAGFVKKEKPKVEFVKKEEPKGPKTEAELRKAYEEAVNRVSYLEVELKQKDARIKELEAAAGGAAGAE